MSEFENFCTLCDVSLGSEAVSLSHFNGQAHKKKLMSPAVVHQCDICNVTCTGEIPFQAHLNSKKHLHKLAVGNTATVDDQSADENDGPLNCDVCGKKFGSRKPARDHFSSDSHKKKVIVFEEIKDGGITPLHCEPCLIKCAVEEELNVHLASISHKKKIDGKFKKTPKIKSGDGTNKDGEDVGALENSVVDNGKPPVTYEHCSLCKVRLVSGSEAAAAHYNSQKHKKKMLKPSGSTVLVCEVCSITCTGTIPFEAHMKSKQHLKKTTPVAEKNSASDEPPTSESNTVNPPQQALTDNNVNDHCDGSGVSPKPSQENNKSVDKREHAGDSASESPEKAQDDNSPKKAKRQKRASLSCELCPVKGLDEKQMAVHILDHKKELEEKKSPKEAVPTRSLRKRKSDTSGSTVDDKVIKMDE